MSIALDQLNVKYAPMEYASQDYDNEIGSAYLDFVKKANAEVLKYKDLFE